MESEALVDTKLHEAVRYGDASEVREALEAGHSPNQIGLYQWSPLHEACNNGDLDIVQLLLKYAGDPNRSDFLRGCTSVHYAACQGHQCCLKALLKAGGKHDILNTDGQTCLDVAVGECRVLLLQMRDKQLIYNTPSLTELQKNVLNCTQLNVVDDKSLNFQSSVESKDSSGKDDKSLLNVDEISITSDSSSSTRPHSWAWGPGSLLAVKKELVLGHVQLSFEYHSKKSKFKVRVWQVTDLLLPPAETSLISALYVKSYLRPDKKKETKRKTEEVKVDADSRERGKDKKSAQIFKPSTFRFSKALDYDGVTEQVVHDRIVELELCVVQKYTRKSFVVATWNLPLSIAVKKLVKEKFPLKPCLSRGIPENMKVYNAGDLDLVRTKGCSVSHPDLHRPSSTWSWAVPYNERCSSDSVLNKVVIAGPSTSCGNSSIEISIPESEDEEFLEDALRQISVMEGSSRSLSSRSVSIELESDDKRHLESTCDISLPGIVTECHHQNDDLETVAIGINPVNSTQVEIHLPFNYHSDQRMLNPGVKTNQATTESYKRSLKKCPSSKDDKTDNVMPPFLSVSRPDSPTWDFTCDHPLAAPMPPLQVEAALPTDRSAQLPMAISLDIPRVHRSFSNVPAKMDPSKIKEP